ncbi:ECs_2282 family putative zinc-binding protein [Leminorella grimontii]|uniref:ECs_2282 family putative zinc-binding protein n=1 Tax=Leminorella grimontii TaxID=82981 RepID=UPI003B8A7FDE
MCPDFTFQCSKCGCDSFRSNHPVKTLDDIHGAICSRCYKTVALRDITEHKIRRMQLIIQRKITEGAPAI